MIRSSSSGRSRALRAAVKHKATVAPSKRRDKAAARARRGHWLTPAPSLWRRCAMGTNRIACKGIWRKGTRRQAQRVNRSGETDWHLRSRKQSQALSQTLGSTPS